MQCLIGTHRASAQSELFRFSAAPTQWRLLIDSYSRGSMYYTNLKPAFPNHIGSLKLFGAVMTTMLVSACAEMPLEPTSATLGTPETAGAATGGAPTASAAMNPMQGARLFVDPATNAAKQAAEWRKSRPTDAAQMDKIAAHAQAVWFGDWTAAPYETVRNVTSKIRSAGALPVYVLYNIPFRDCGLHSSGGASTPAEYDRWISEVARGIGSERATVVLEPDALAGMDCLDGGRQNDRVQMILQAVRTLKKSGTVSVYIDAGNSRWHSPEAIGANLKRVGISEADGFALNVSNYIATDEVVKYGSAVSAQVGGKHFVVDTSRNGQGATADSQWCNPSGRGLGPKPSTNTGVPLVDAYLWIKSPGESDGECNGGPRAGSWWADYALGLAQRSVG